MKKSDTIDRWGHDLYDATEQTPKSDQEFLDQYGFERNQVHRYSVLFYKYLQTQFSILFSLLSLFNIVVNVQTSLVLRMKKV